MRRTKYKIYLLKLTACIGHTFFIMALSKSDRQFMKKFGLKMRELREKKGWTLEFTEEKDWSHWQYLQQIESGKSNVTLSTLLKLSRLYRISLSEMFNDL